VSTLRNRLIALLCPWWVIRRQQRIIDNLQTHADHLNGILTNPQVVGMEVASQQLEIGLKGPMCEYMAAMLGGLVLGCPEAENYLELKLETPEGPFTVIVTRPGGGRSPHQLRQEAEAELTRLRGLLAAAGAGATPESLKLGRLALAVINDIGKRAANGEQLTIAPDFGYGTATLITGDGNHTHVGGDTGENTQENLAMLIVGLFDQLVEGQGLSWVDPRNREVQP
jgi:hypothetical protein